MTARHPQRGRLPSDAILPLWVYRSLFPIAFAGMLPGFALRMAKRGNYRHKFGQRFGIFSDRAQKALEIGGWTWIHAVSVGEMMMGVQLARHLRHRDPSIRILFSTTTSTGFALARGEIKKLRRETGFGPVELIYYPLDLGVIVRRVLNLVQPRELILVDKEFWPNMVSECYRQQIPVSVVNARLSERSARRFSKWKRWTGPFFAMLKRVCVQEPEDLARWESLGVKREALVDTGSLKFDAAPVGAKEGSLSAPSLSARSEQFQRILAQIGVKKEDPILLGGSTFPGEEKALGRVLKKARAYYPNLFLIVVPRHVERRAEVEADLHAEGLTYRLRSSLSVGSSSRENEVPTARPDVLIVDTTGELRDWYPLATLCFIGKSLKAKLGQNPAEPLLAGRPVLFGPYMQNFQSLVDRLLAVEGATQVQSEAELTAAVLHGLSSPEAMTLQVERGRNVLKRHFGAYERVVDQIVEARSH